MGVRDQQPCTGDVPVVGGEQTTGWVAAVSSSGSTVLTVAHRSLQAGQEKTAPGVGGVGRQVVGVECAGAVRKTGLPAGALVHQVWEEVHQVVVERALQGETAGGAGGVLGGAVQAVRQAGAG